MAHEATMKLRTDEFRSRLADARAQWSQPGDRDKEIVLHYGDVMNEYWAVRDGGLGLIDRSDRETLVLSGDDTISWLQGLITSDLFELEREGSGHRSTMVNQVGKAMADMRILHIPQMLVVDLEPGGLSDSEVMGHLARHIIMEKVKAEDRTAQTARLTLTGAHAMDLLGKVARLAHRPATLTHDYMGSWGHIAGCDVVVQRVALTGEPTFDISCSREHALKVWDALFQGSEQVRVVGAEALEMLRLEAGVPRMDGVEYHAKIIPIEANLNHTISYSKGCYLGQEIIARLDTRGTPAKMLRAVLVPQGSPMQLAVGQACLDPKGKKVGTLIKVSRAPSLDDRAFGWAYLKRGSYEEGAQVSIEESELMCEVLAPGALLEAAR